jgi:hypothetical protein
MIKKYLLKNLLVILLLVLIPTHALAAISFITRVQNNTNSTPASVSVTIPGSVVANDYLVAYINSFGATDPKNCVNALGSQWTTLGYGFNNHASSNNYQVVCAKVAVNADASSTLTTISTLGFPKLVVRVYRGENSFSPIDQVSGPTCLSSSSSLTIPAMPATLTNNEWYVANWMTNGSTAITGITDLNNVTNDTTQWNTYEGDKNMGSAGSTPNAETANSASNGWCGFAFTLNSLADDPTPTPLATPAMLISDRGAGSIFAWFLTDTGNQTPRTSLSGFNTHFVSGATGPAVSKLDSAGNLYVMQLHEIDVFGPKGSFGNILPIAILTDSTHPSPQYNDLSIDGSNNIWLSDAATNYVSEYPPLGSQTGYVNMTATTTVQGSNTGFLFPGVSNVFGGNFFVGNESTVGKFPTTANGNVAPTTSLSGAATHINLCGPFIDSSGNIWCAQELGNEIDEYFAGSSGNHAPDLAIVGGSTGLNSNPTLTLDHNGNVYSPNVNAPSVTVYSSGSSGNVAPIQTISGGSTSLNAPIGVALFDDFSPTPTNTPTATATATATLTATPTATPTPSNGVVYVNSTFGAPATVPGTCTATTPAGITPGDCLLYVFISPDLGGQFVPTVGSWTLLNPQGGGIGGPAIYYHVVNGSEVSSYTSTSGTNAPICFLADYTNTNGSCTFRSFQAVTSNFSTFGLGHSLSAVAGDMFIFLPTTKNGDDSCTITSTSSGMIQRQNVPHQFDGGAMALNDQQVVSTGNTSTPSVNFNGGTCDNRSESLLLEPAPAPTATPTPTQHGAIWVQE